MIIKYGYALKTNITQNNYLKMRDKVTDYPRAVYYTSSDDLHNSIFEYEFAINGIDPHTHQKLIAIPTNKIIVTNHTYIHLWDENKQYINSIRNNG